jgi:hypothetical protein
MQHARGLAKDTLIWPGRKWRKLVKKAKHSDAIMTGILVTRFKMGQIDVEDLEEMAADTTWAERCSAAKKVLEAVRDSPDIQRQEKALRTPAPRLKRG